MSITRIHLDDEDEASALAAAIDALGFDVAVIGERFAGEDDDEAIEYVVHTPATPEELGDLIGDDHFVTTD